MSNTTHVLAIVRTELRRGWRELLLIGLLAAVVGATTIGSVSLSRRTATAYERLERTTGADDARGLLLQHDDLLDELVALPSVTQSWVGRSGVAQVDGGFIFLGVTAGPAQPSSMLDPVVLEGRLPGPADGDVIEVALRDDFQREVGIPLGTEMPVRFLSSDDYLRFDTGFANDHPNGPELTLRVVGTIRLPAGPASLPAVAATDALQRHPDAFGPAAAWFVELEAGERSVDAFRASVSELFGDRRLPDEASEFEVASVIGTADAQASVENTAGLLATALLVLAGSVGLVGLVAVGQAIARHRAPLDHDWLVHRALGITSGERRLAALATASIPALLAGLIAAAGGAIAGRLDPIGAIRNYEPNPGSAVNLSVVVVGTALTIIAVLLMTLATTMRSSSTHSPLPQRESRMVALVARRGGGPAAALGLRFALEPGRGAGAVPVRSAVAGAVIGMSAVVGGVVFTSSLTRLVDTPARAGLPYDVLVSNADEGVRKELLREPGVGSVIEISTAPLQIEGRSIGGYAMTSARGELHVDLVSGRLPRTPDEITLGLRIADELGTGVGDTVTAVDRRGRPHELAVVGTGVVPVFNGEPLGLNALTTTAGLTAVAVSDPFASVALRSSAGTDPLALGERLAERFEAGPGTTPAEVDNLRQLGSLPALVALVLGLIGLAALANALVVLVRRRRGDLALLRTLGLGRRQIGVVVLVMAGTIASIGALVGIPLGLAAGSTIWRLAATGAFVAADPLVRWWVPVAVAGAGALVAAITAVLPARRATRISPALLLRQE